MQRHSYLGQFGVLLVALVTVLATSIGMRGGRSVSLLPEPSGAPAWQTLTIADDLVVLLPADSPGLADRLFASAVTQVPVPLPAWASAAGPSWRVGARPGRDVRPDERVIVGLPIAPTPRPSISTVGVGVLRSASASARDAGARHSWSVGLAAHDSVHHLALTELSQLSSDGTVLVPVRIAAMATSDRPNQVPIVDRVVILCGPETTGTHGCDLSTLQAIDRTAEDYLTKVLAAGMAPPSIERELAIDLARGSVRPGRYRIHLNLNCSADEFPGYYVAVAQRIEVCQSATTQEQTLHESVRHEIFHAVHVRRKT